MQDIKAERADPILRQKNIYKQPWRMKTVYPVERERDTEYQKSCKPY